METSNSPCCGGGNAGGAGVVLCLVQGAAEAFIAALQLSQVQNEQLHKAEMSQMEEKDIHADETITQVVPKEQQLALLSNLVRVFFGAVLCYFLALVTFDRYKATT
mgnify:FL=1